MLLQVLLEVYQKLPEDFRPSQIVFPLIYLFTFNFKYRPQSELDNNKREWPYKIELPFVIGWMCLLLSISLFVL